MLARLLHCQCDRSSTLLSQTSTLLRATTFCDCHFSLISQSLSISCITPAEFLDSDQHVDLIYNTNDEDNLQEGRPHFLGSSGRNHPVDVLRLQRWPVLPHLHPRRHSTNLRVRPHRHQDTKEQVGYRSLPRNVYLLHGDLRSTIRAVHVLQGTLCLIQGYLPNDTTGNLIFKIQEGFALLLSGYILYCLCTAFKASYNQDLDTVKSYYIIAVAAVLALVFHSSLNRSFIGDYLWAFSQYLETFAILSQFVLFRNKVTILPRRKAISKPTHPTSWPRRESRESCS